MYEEKRGFFGRLKDRLTKTRESFVASVRVLFAGRSVIDDDLLEELEQILIQADIGVDTTMAIISDMRVLAREKRLASPDEFLNLLKDELVKILEPGDHTLTWNNVDGPHVTLIAGVNGSGKTTTTGKIAAKLKSSGKSVMLGAADTFRAAAVEQLTVWSDRAGVPIIKHQDGADPAAVAFDAADAAASRSIDCLLIDTAGRLHTKVNLMEELRKVQRVIARRIPGAPHEVLLVLDATTGQNALQQARVFTEALTVTGIVLTKLDGTAKGGIAVAVQKQLGIPIKLIGVGEGIDDLQPFNAREFVDALFA
ncbi:MAG TPA: signal recognition particle-docking protein FtsY [Candidatus Hydrogenedentes bacterium]|nr:signal recognition particle-docking protein FtsY [Candidatus Hydrogenedentota bacterium]HRK35358.1 signal recognition particle-docking protein FtsY [Candidatus Hydrogenedentota bacterium]